VAGADAAGVVDEGAVAAVAAVAAAAAAVVVVVLKGRVRVKGL
jgi:hypothetical protein